MNSLLLVEYLVIEMNVYRLDWRIESGELSNSVEEKKNLRFFNWYSTTGSKYLLGFPEKRENTL